MGGQTVGAAMIPWITTILAALVGLIVGLLLGDPVPGVVFGLGLLLGAVASVVVVPALRAAPAGIKGAAIDDAGTGWVEFHRELARARRFDRPFAIVRFSVGRSPDQGLLVGLRNEIAAISRRIDRVWIDEDHILLLLPEATEAAAKAALSRVHVGVAAAVAFEPGLALYPEHGITSGALIAAVYGSGQAEVPTPIAAARPELWLQSAAGVSQADGPAGTSDEVASQSG
jgi:hypothetical protein